jgi:hypothetical protein
MVRSKFKDEHPFGKSPTSSSCAKDVGLTASFSPSFTPIHKHLSLHDVFGDSATSASVPVPIHRLIDASTDKRKAEAERIRQKYPDRIPVCPLDVLSWCVF